MDLKCRFFIKYAKMETWMPGKGLLISIFQAGGLKPSLKVTLHVSLGKKINVYEAVIRVKWRNNYKFAYFLKYCSAFRVICVGLFTFKLSNHPSNYSDSQSQPIASEFISAILFKVQIFALHFFWLIISESLGLSPGSRHNK